MSMLQPLLSNLSNLSDMSVVSALPEAGTAARTANGHASGARAPRGTFSRATVTKPWKRLLVNGQASALPYGVARDRSARFDSFPQAQANTFDRAR